MSIRHCWVLAVVFTLDAAAQRVHPTPPPIEVLVIGTYHFDNPGQDLAPTDPGCSVPRGRGA